MAVTDRRYRPYETTSGDFANKRMKDEASRSVFEWGAAITFRLREGIRSHDDL